MFSISLGADGAELRPLEPRHAVELLDQMDRGRESIGVVGGQGNPPKDVSPKYLGLDRRRSAGDADGFEL